MLTKLIFKSLWIDFRSSASFIIALSVGLIGLSVIFSARTAIEFHMAQRAQEILGADLSISARRLFNDQEKQQIKNLISEHPHYNIYSLFTMAASDSASKLSYLKAITPEEHPFYGELSDEKNRPLDFSPSEKRPVIYGDQQLFEQLNAKAGDLIKIGSRSFVLKGPIFKDSSQGFRFSALAPKAYIEKEQLKQTGLIGFGSTVSENIYVKIKDKNTLLLLQKEIGQKLSDTSIRITTADEAAKSSIRALSYLGDYLGLISLVGFLLSALGAGFIFFESLSKQLKIFSIYQSLGLSRFRSLVYLIAQVLCLSFIASFLSFLISLPLFKVISHVLLSQFEFSTALKLNPLLFLWLFGLSFMSALIMSLPHLWALIKSPMRNLLDASLQGVTLKKSGVVILTLSTLFILMVSFLLSRSFKISLFFTFGLMIIFFFVGALGTGLTSLLNRWQLRSYFKVAFQEMNGKKSTQVILFAVITLSILMLDSIKQIEHSLQQQLAVSDKKDIPSYFLFDIQDEQVEPLKASVEKVGLTLLQASPMVRAKMISINSEAYEVVNDESRFETREEEEEARFRNRGLNLSYRAHLQPGETLIEGKDFEGHYSPDEPVQLSVESDYARRVNISLGDRVQMDIQGFPVEGVVKNLRRVSWTTFLPNFFVITQPGLLEDAPKTWLAGLSRGEPSAVGFAVRELNKSFPNVSFVNLDEVITQIQEITGQMSQALVLTALLVLIAGLFILFSVSRFHFFESQKDLNLLKVLGANSSYLSKKIFVEQITLTLTCLTLGLGGSATFSWMILDKVFETPLFWTYQTPLILSVGLLLLATFMTFLVRRWSQRTSPKQFL